MDTDRTEVEKGMNIGFERATYGVSRFDLDAMGERAVRDDLNSGKYGHAGLAPFAFVSAWLADAEFVRLSADSVKRDAREAETLSIAKDALSTAKDAALSAKAATSAATAAALEAAAANKIAASNLRTSKKSMAAAVVAAIAAIVAAYAAIKGIK